MRALLVTDSHIWTAETEYAVEVALAERDAGWDVQVAAPEGSAALEATRELDSTSLPGPHPGRSPADFLANTRFLSGLIGEASYDVVHSSRSASHLACALALGGRAPLVHLRGGAQRPRFSVANRFLYNRLTDRVVVSSGRIEEWVIQGLGVPEARVCRLLAPVDVDRLSPTRDRRIRAELGLEPAAKMIVNVARLAPVKGQRVLVGAMPRVVEMHPEAVVVLVGEPWSGEPAGLLQLARELGVERSLFVVGRRDDVPAVLAEADVCVSSSIGSEENSRAVSEYMAAGRPVVASRVGVVPELIRDGVTGLLVEPGDAYGLSKALVSMLDHPERASRMAAEALSFARSQLSRGAFAEHLTRLLDEIGAGRATGAAH